MNENKLPDWITDDICNSLNMLIISNYSKAIELFTEISHGLNRNYTLYETVELLHEIKEQSQSNH